ncbi:MAG: ImmA/IrrE family metallo-endopeptidase [Bacteroidetes bacterium]|nr:ImmA/IrrE family metallo-endopeptidase [Bacteroidota bacterium]
MTPSQIEQLALDTRRKTIVDGPSIPVHEIAVLLGMRIEYPELGKDISGLLLIEDGQPIIGINSKHPHVRQRFTIAHEIAHYVLGHIHHSDIFVDEDNFLKVYRRDIPRSRDNKRERDANTFAGALLMPSNLLHEELDNRSLGLFDDKDWKKLADRFEVSTQALLIRLTKLGFFGPSY